MWPRFHTKPLQAALSRRQCEAFCSGTLKRCLRYLSRHIFLSPTVQYVILKAVQSVCERDRPSEEPLITWSNAKNCQYGFKLWLKMGKWLNKCKYCFYHSFVCLQSTVNHINIVYQGRIVIYICGGFTLANTHPASHSFPLPQNGEKKGKKTHGSC